MYGEIVRALPFICHGVGASPHRPLHAYIDIYGETVRALPCPFVGRMLLRPTPPVLVFLSVRVGAYCIRPTKYLRKGDGGGGGV